MRGRGRRARLQRAELRRPRAGRPVYRQRLVFRPDWENVVGPVIDYALTLPGVDGAKIVLWGLSMGGELAPRAAAFEHRLAALVAVDGLYDMGATVLGQAGEVPDFERRLRADAGPGPGRRNRPADRGQPGHALGDRPGPVRARGAHPAPGVRRPAGLSPARRDRREDHLPGADLRRPHDLFFAGQARLLFDHLTCPKTFLEFTEEEGADEHCQVGAERLAMARVCNWLDDTLGAPGQLSSSGDTKR